MARRNAREKARRRSREAGMTDRFRAIVADRKRQALAAVSTWHRARLRGAGKASADVRITLTGLFAVMRVVSFEDAFKAHAAGCGIDPLQAQAEIEEFHERVFNSWMGQPGNGLWHTVTVEGLTKADTAVTYDEVLACIPGPGRPTGGWRLMTRPNDPVWRAVKNRHAAWANGNGEALQKAIDDAVAVGLISPPATPVPQLPAIT